MIPQLIGSNEASHFVWRVEGKSPTVEFSTGVLAALRRKLEGDQQPVRLEFGGILLGTMEEDAGSWHTVVEDWERFPIEHRFGDQYVLTPRDRRHFARKIQHFRRRRLQPVGLFRSHERRGLYMDQRDFELFQAEFNHPGSVFFLLSGDPLQGVKGAVFIWEDGDIRRHVSYKEFSLDEFGAPPENRPPKPLPAPPAERRVRSTLPHPVSKPPHSAPPPLVESGFGLRPLALGFLAVALPLGAFYLGRELASSRYNSSAGTARPAHTAAAPADTSTPRGAASTGDIALRSRPVGRYLEFDWDPESGPVQRAQLGRLTVHDGDSDVQVWLSLSDLKAGSYRYVPTDSEVSARLDLFSPVGGQAVPSPANR